MARGAEIRAVLRRGRRYATSAGVLRVTANAAGEHRLCVIVSRHVGGAVVRNRVRRCVREAVRRELGRDVTARDLVFRAQPECARLASADLRESVTRLLADAGLLAPADPDRWR